MTCFGQAKTNASKCSVPDCDKIIEVFVGFKKPANVNIGAGTAGHWWTAEDEISGIAVDEADKNHVNVVTLILDEDKVSSLHGNVF